MCRTISDIVIVYEVSLAVKFYVCPELLVLVRMCLMAGTGGAAVSRTSYKITREGLVRAANAGLAMSESAARDGERWRPNTLD